MNFALDDDDATHLRRSSQVSVKSVKKLGRTTPLHRIAGAGLFSRLQELIDQGEVSWCDCVSVIEIPVINSKVSLRFIESIPNFYLSHICIPTQYPVDGLDENGRTPLMHAVHFNRFDCAALLLKHGANVNFQEPYDDATCLHGAAFTGSHVILFVHEQLRLMKVFTLFTGILYLFIY